MNKFCTLLILILLGCSSSSENALSINALFSDNMIVQQNAKLNIWGKAPQGSLIHVSSSWGRGSYNNNNSRWKMDPYHSDSRSRSQATSIDGFL